MFRGDENPLVMKQVYTHRFQCSFDVERYPFDIQRCSIEMVLGSYDVKMVRLVPSNFSMNQDKEMALFTITSWELEYRTPHKSEDGLRFNLVLKRKIMNCLLTTYLPTILLILITFATTYLKSFFFEAALSANLTIMLVMTTIFIGEMQMLPSTAYIKMVDIWLVFCQLVPFAEVTLLIAMEYHRGDVRDGKAATVETSNCNEIPTTTLVEEMLTGQTAFEEPIKGVLETSFEAGNNWLCRLNILGEFK